jgi:hypothetical protein
MTEFAALLDKIPAWVWAVSVVGVTLLGFVNLLLEMRGAAQKHDFSREFRKKFVDYVNSRGKDRDSYHKMMLQSNRMQAEMGSFGIMHHFRDPPLEYKNYGIILNGLPRIRREFEEDHFFSRAEVFVQMFDDALVRFLGSLDDDLEGLKKSLRNPVAWFRRGAEQIALLPFLFFEAFGVMGRKTLASIRTARVFKFLTAVLALLGFTASVIALLVDGSEALGIVRGWFSQGAPPTD